ncbi:hypothetical protein [Brevibacillus panacihumi]|uniref:hypothetical protein n=1 Tax=Brevibacillus panacihumi TaxID=497735 RepID=UPI003D22A047
MVTISKHWVVSALVLLLSLAVLFVFEVKTDASSTTIEMEIKEDEMKYILENEKKISRAFNSKFDLNNSKDFNGDVKLDLKFKKMKGNKQHREVLGKATVKMGGEKFVFRIEEGSLVKTINQDGEEVYFLDADSTFKTSEGEEVISTLTFAWTKDYSKTEGAIAVGTIDNFSYIPFGNSDVPLRGITEKDRQYLADQQQEFGNNEYTGE